MRRIILLLAATLFLPACPAKNVTLAKPGAFRPQQQVTAPKFVVLPAVDQRPTWEKSGDSPGVTFRLATAGAAMFWWAGAEVLADKNIVYGRNRFSGTSRNASTMVSSDLGEVLERSTRRPVQFWRAALSSQRGVANAVKRMRLADGTVVILPVIDHLTRVRAKTKQASASQSKRYTSTHVITTTRSSRASQTTGPVWTVMMRLHVFEVRGGRVARHVVRYAAASSGRQNAYGMAVVRAAKQVVRTSALVFSMANLRTPTGPPGGQPPTTSPTGPTGPANPARPANPVGPTNPTTVDPEQNRDPEQDPRNRPPASPTPAPPI